MPKKQSPGWTHPLCRQKFQFDDYWQKRVSAKGYIEVCVGFCTKKKVCKHWE